MVDLSVHRERIIEVVLDLEDALDLDWLIITHLFDEAERSDGVIAETSAMWEYRKATVTWVLPAVALLDDEELETTALHEYMHILVAPIVDQLGKNANPKMEEFAVESLARVVLAARRARDTMTVVS